MDRRARRGNAPLLAVACVTLLSIAGGASVVASDRDAQEVAHYVLTAAGLAKFSSATQNLNKLGKSVQSNCDDESESPSSLDKVVARADANPGVKSAIQSAGMGTREYFVFSMAMLQAGLAAWGMDQAGGKLPPGVSKANVDFYRAHKAAIDKMGVGNKDQCHDSADDRDSEQ